MEASNKQTNIVWIYRSEIAVAEPDPEDSGLFEHPDPDPE